MRLAVGTHLLTLFIRDIGNDDAVHTCFLAAGKEPLGTIGVNRISVGQKYQGHLGLLTQLGHQVKNLVGGGACCQRTQIGTLDNLALGHGIRKGNTKFHQTRAAVNHRHNQLLGYSKVWVTRSDKTNENLFIFSKCILNPSHVNQPPYSVR